MSFLSKYIHFLLFKRNYLQKYLMKNVDIINTNNLIFIVVKMMILSLDILEEKLILNYLFNCRYLI